MCVCVGGGGGGGCCPLLAVKVSALSADSISGGRVLSAFSQWGVRMYVNFYYTDRGGGGGGVMAPLGMPMEALPIGIRYVFELSGA